MPIYIVSALIIMALSIIVVTLVFAQTTVRKIENNPTLMDQVGIEFINGWRIFNIAEALAMPLAIFNRIKSSPLGVLYANAEPLRESANRLDKFLAHLLFWQMYLFLFFILFVMVADLIFGAL
ncbi:hypothetical protein OLMES_1298 [Oleiphilus messinensis]|uniref:Uncharacterized protein n=1 Tax=Oleiphilus messinensis TaxID=141451 RepID=A0A1Y0I4G3_9GAMM|nr:hypothetical protein [Oleiphilus messinensis]ARU55377.1 hypothetical protein OLMES_1298 [Oleiphilus messinensis]